MNRRKTIVLIALIVIVGGIVALHLARSPRPTVTTSIVPLPQDAYIWQRVWTPAVCDAVKSESPHVRRFVPLVAEMSFAGEEARVTEFHPDYANIASTVHEIGIAIRIGPLPAASASAMKPDSLQSQSFRDVVTRAIANAQKAGMNVVEVQIDFDCAESKLAAYTQWLRGIRSCVGSIPIVITTLPSWLKHSEFAVLVKESGSYVLQVHSLHRPAHPDDPMTICDVDEARPAIADAIKIGVPFRVALPTYSYLIGFSPDGKFLGLSAEGPAKSWPEGTITRMMEPDTNSLADLVRDFSTQRPSLMTGIIWYRLPISTDAMNWRAATWHAVMEGRRPVANVQAEISKTKPELTDIYLVNSGDADAPLQCDVTVKWEGAEMLYAEGMGGFDRLDAGPGGVTFHAQNATGRRRIAPGERIEIGWLRLSSDKEVRANVSNFQQK